MRLPVFNDLIQKLERDPYFAIAVFDLTNGSDRILKPTVAAGLKNVYGSVENYFDQIFNDSIKEIGIKVMRQNGNSWKDGKEPYVKVENPAQVQPSLFTDPVQPKNIIPDHMGLNGLAGAMLNIPTTHYTELHHDAKEKIRLQKELDELKIKYQSAKKKNKEFEKREQEEEKAIKKLDVKNKGYADLIEKSTPLLAPILTKLAGMLDGQAIPTGLATPEVQADYSNLSPNKQSIIEGIIASDELTAEIIGRVYDGLGVDLFANELSELLTKHTV